MEIVRFFIYRGMLYRVKMRYITTVNEDKWTHHRYVITIKNITENLIAQFQFRMGLGFDAKPTEEHLHSALGCFFEDATYIEYDIEELKSQFGYNDHKARLVFNQLLNAYGRAIRLGFRRDDIFKFAEYYREHGKVPLELKEKIPKIGGEYVY